MDSDLAAFLARAVAMAVEDTMDDGTHVLVVMDPEGSPGAPPAWASEPIGGGIVNALASAERVEKELHDFDPDGTPFRVYAIPVFPVTPSA